MNFFTLIEKIKRNRTNSSSKIEKNSYNNNLKIKIKDKEKNDSYKNNYDIAIDYYTKSINKNKENIIYLIKRAICYLVKGYYLLALKDALKAIKIDNKFSKDKIRDKSRDKSKDKTKKEIVDDKKEYNDINILNINLILLCLAIDITKDKDEREFLENLYEQFLLFMKQLSRMKKVNGY